MRLVVGSSFVAGLLACSGAEGPKPAAGTSVVFPSAPASPVAASGRPVAYFDGHVDAARGTMVVTFRPPPSSQVSTEDQLPYGTGPGQVFFHTCGAPSYSASILSGAVQAVNQTSGTVVGLNAVIDSISVTGVTLSSGPGAGSSSGVIAAYGDTPVNTATCASTQPWSFRNVAGDPNFTFQGHAEGTPPAVTCTRTVTTSLSEANPYSQAVVVSFSMVGGGGGGPSASFGTAGAKGATLSSAFSLGVGATLSAFAGGGGGSGGWCPGNFGGIAGAGGGGAGAFGGGGGGVTQGGGSSFGGGGGGGSSQILVNGAVIGTAAGGLGGGVAGFAEGGVAGSTVGGAGGDGLLPPNEQGGDGSGGNGGAGGGGFGQGGSGATGGFSVAGTGGSNGGDGLPAVPPAPTGICGGGGGGGYGGGGGGGYLNGGGGSQGEGLGATNWASASTLPAEAGAGGGNAGLVILTYTSPNGVCSL